MDEGEEKSQLIGEPSLQRLDYSLYLYTVENYTYTLGCHASACFFLLSFLFLTDRVMCDGNYFYNENFVLLVTDSTKEILVNSLIIFIYK